MVVFSGSGVVVFGAGAGVLGEFGAFAGFHMM
jgi:hypothetical protein